jgi:competence protein ComEC
LLRALGERVDTVLLSHRDSDHVGGAQAVLAMQPQAALISSMEEGHALHALRQPTRCVAGMHWQWDGVDFELLHPMPGDYDGAAKSNALSCVLRVSTRRQAALLVGDIEAEQEASLLQRGAALKADVLLVPHHGSKTSSSERFLDAVAPRIALVQSGYRNRFGHPAPSVVARYDARGIQLVDSPHCGAAAWRSAQPEQLQCQRESNRRYWHHLVP